MKHFPVSLSITPKGPSSGSVEQMFKDIKYMKDLPDFTLWFKDLCSDQKWYEFTCMSVGKGKNFKQAAESVYGELLADCRIQHRDMIENRKHVANKLGKMKFETLGICHRVLLRHCRIN